MRNKKEKTPNNVLKSPLRVAVKQSCSLEEGKICNLLSFSLSKVII